MENAIVSIITIAMILGGTVTLVFSALSPLDTIANSWKQMTQETGDIMRTDISGIDSSVPELYAGNRVALTIRNDGNISLTNYDSWDVIVQYNSDNSTSPVKWLPYTTSLADNKWTVNGIYFNGDAEKFEPNILNPGEDMEILLQLNPAVSANTTNLATISTPKGVSTQIIFQRAGP